MLKHARRLLADLPDVEVRGLHLRAVVLCPAELQRTCVSRLSRLFGVTSLAAAERTQPDLDAIAEVAVAAARALPPGTSFKVETRRRNKQFPLDSQQISRQIGHRVIVATGLPVDLHTPQRTLRIELGAESAYVFDEVVPGAGGLPAGVSGRVSLLLSGGIDSPVAGWSAMRRGCLVEAIYFHSFPYTGDKTKQKVLDLARILARWQVSMRVHVVDFTEVQKQLRAAGRPDLAVVLYRRMMMRAASVIAARNGSKALVTGENLGQVASQTIENLTVIEDAAALPVLRPLIMLDKEEIIVRAQAIDTFDTSILPYEDCCSLFVPKHPATRARLSDVIPAETKLDVTALAQQLADGAEPVQVTRR